MECAAAENTAQMCIYEDLRESYEQVDFLCKMLNLAAFIAVLSGKFDLAKQLHLGAI